MKNLSIFIVSSGEGLEVARAIGYQLHEDAEVTIWNEGVFNPGEAFLEYLVSQQFNFQTIYINL